MNDFSPRQRAPSFEKSPRINTQQVFSGKWLKLNLAEYLTNDSSSSTYEYIERTTKKRDFDGIFVVGIMKFPKSKKPSKLILEANFRPPIDKYVLEFPAGMIENEDDCLGGAIRELKEETGYTPSKILEVIQVDDFLQVSPTLCIDPWKSNDCELMILVEVDGDDEINKNAKQDLETTENIIVHLIDLSADLWQDIMNLAREKDYVIVSKLYSFITGLALGKKLLE